MRCGATRSYELDRYGYVVRREAYRYPEGYVLEGVGRVTKDMGAEIRLLSIGEGS